MVVEASKLLILMHLYHTTDLFKTWLFWEVVGLSGYSALFKTQKSAILM
jgi:hypothetical protein